MTFDVFDYRHYTVKIYTTMILNGRLTLDKKKHMANESKHIKKIGILGEY